MALWSSSGQASQRASIYGRQVRQFPHCTVWEVSRLWRNSTQSSYFTNANSNIINNDKTSPRDDYLLQLQLGMTPPGNTAMTAPIQQDDQLLLFSQHVNVYHYSKDCNNVNNNIDYYNVSIQ